MKKQGKPVDELNAFGERFKIVFFENGISQSALSRLVGVTQPEIHYWLNAKAYPRPYHLQSVCYYLDVKYSWLRSGEGNKDHGCKNAYPLEDFWSSEGGRLTFQLWFNGIKPIDLASFLGIGYTLVEYWVEEKRPISQIHYPVITRVLGCDLSWLKFGHDGDTVKKNALSRLHGVVPSKRHPQLRLS